MRSGVNNYKFKIDATDEPIEDYANSLDDALYTIIHHNYLGSQSSPLGAAPPQSVKITSEIIKRFDDGSTWSAKITLANNNEDDKVKTRVIIEADNDEFEKQITESFKKGAKTFQEKLDVTVLSIESPKQIKEQIALDEKRQQFELLQEEARNLSLHKSKISGARYNETAKKLDGLLYPNAEYTGSQQERLKQIDQGLRSVKQQIGKYAEWKSKSRVEKTWIRLQKSLQKRLGKKAKPASTPEVQSSVTSNAETKSASTGTSSPPSASSESLISRSNVERKSNPQVDALENLAKSLTPPPSQPLSQEEQLRQATDFVNAESELNRKKLEEANLKVTQPSTPSARPEQPSTKTSWAKAVKVETEEKPIDHEEINKAWDYLNALVEEDERQEKVEKANQRLDDLLDATEKPAVDDALLSDLNSTAKANTSAPQTTPIANSQSTFNTRKSFSDAHRFFESGAAAKHGSVEEMQKSEAKDQVTPKKR